MRALEPKSTPADLFFEITSERGMGAGSHTIAQRRAEAKHASSYVYRLEWDTPVEGGKWRSPHSLDLVMIFDNVGKSASIIGEGAGQAQRVADAMSAAWINFARKGDPNGKGVAKWEAYDVTKEPVMEFNIASKTVSDATAGRRKALSAKV